MVYIRISFSFACCTVFTVPAPARNPGQFFFISSIAFTPFSVRNVTSNVSILALLNALATGTACFSSLKTANGMTPICFNFSITLFIDIPPVNFLIDTVC